LVAVLRRALVWAAIGSLFLDQLTKVVIHGMYRSGALADYASVKLLGEVVRLTYEKNPQGVFGLRYGPPWLYFVLPLLGCVLVVWFGLRTRGAWLSAAYGLVLGGAAGNLIDRARLGYVIDFIVVEIKALRFRWFTWNLADGFVVVGIIMLLGYELFGRRKTPEPGPESKEGESAPSLPG
jgi:signal peptidase II